MRASSRMVLKFSVLLKLTYFFLIVCFSVMACQIVANPALRDISGCLQFLAGHFRQYYTFPRSAKYWGFITVLAARIDYGYIHKKVIIMSNLKLKGTQPFKFVLFYPRQFGSLIIVKQVETKLNIFVERNALNISKVTLPLKIGSLNVSNFLKWSMLITFSNTWPFKGGTV